MNPTIRKKIVDLAAILPILERLRAQGKRIVQCHGCFDVVHPGHIRHLADAAEYGDVLLVSVTADPQIDKGVGRPFVPQELRCENLAALSLVDYVIVDTESWAGPLLEKTRPDAYVKGLEYATNKDPRFFREKQIVERYGGVVVYTSGEVVYSSTLLAREQLDDADFERDRLRSILSRHGITRSSLEDRMRQFADVELVVVGDAILDHYVECEQGGLPTEAPVLQVSPISERFYVGGACVMALHAAELGARVTYVGFLAEDDRRADPGIRETLESRGVRVLAIPSEVRLMKTRYLVEGQKVFKVDRCRPAAITSAQETQWLAELERAFSGAASGLIAVDYGYGTLTHPRMQAAAKVAATRNARIFGDTTTNRFASLGKFEQLHCDAIFPCEIEARAYLGHPDVGLPILASELFANGLAKAIALTLGPRGLVLFDRERRSVDAEGGERYLPEYLPALANYAVDPLGAGDALTTCAALVRLAGGSYVEAVVLGSVAASICVRTMGNEPIRLDTLLRSLRRDSLFSVD